MSRNMFDIFGVGFDDDEEDEETPEEVEFRAWKKQVDAEWKTMDDIYFQQTGEHLLDPAELPFREDYWARLNGENIEGSP